MANFRSAGARCVIVSGVVDAAYRVHADMIPRAALTVCRLRAGWDELRLRFAGRWEIPGLVQTCCVTLAQWTRAMLETCAPAPVPCRWARWRGLRGSAVCPAFGRR